MSHSNHFILGLLAQTSIHAGAESSTGAIDLPIQREGHSHIPCIFGSSVKGALRAHAEQFLDESEVVQVFGSAMGQQAMQAGALGISDARLLLLPVRSLTSHFKWVTCPQVIKRYMRDRSLLGLSSVSIESLLGGVKFDTGDKSEFAFVPKTADEQQPTNLFLEEYCYKTQPSDLSGLIGLLAALMERSDTEAELKEQLVVVSDDAFAYLSQHATPVNPHIAIESDTKIVRPGALWYEETLPPETLLYVPVMANNGRAHIESDNLNAKDIAAIIHDLFEQRAWLQIGGNETVGMGWCAVSVERDHDE